MVTYSWYRFADQPALQNADLTDAERAKLQHRVELLHRHWTKEREYLPAHGGDIGRSRSGGAGDSPKGMEIGYVPIVTRQGVAE